MRPATEDMLTIDPRPADRIIGTTAAVQRKAPVRLTSTTRRHSAASIRQIGALRSSAPVLGEMPALLTKAVMGPKTSAPCAIAARTAASSVISAVRGSDEAPCAAAAFA